MPSLLDPVVSSLPVTWLVIQVAYKMNQPPPIMSLAEFASFCDDVRVSTDMTDEEKFDALNNYRFKGMGFGVDTNK